MIVIHDYPSGEVRHVLLGGKQYTIAQLLALITEHAALTAENARLQTALKDCLNDEGSDE